MSKTKRSKAHEVLNDKMVQFAPELASEYALCPLEYSRWKAPEETHEPTGAPCFLASPTDNGLKMNYVYCRKKDNLEAGYYHIRTQEAYKELYARLCREGFPGGSCCHVGKARKEYADFTKVKRIVYNRSIAPEPNDVLAARAAVLGSSANAGALQQGRRAAELPLLTSSVIAL